jgi:hypothetical protein
MFGSLLGASGGPKWFVLSRLDQLLAGEFFAGRSEPIASLGSSIGSWRHACYAQARPVEALQRLEENYIQQHYSVKPDRHEVSRVARQSVDYILGASGTDEIVNNPVWHTHIVAVRSRWPVASDSTLPLALGLGASAMGNAVSRHALGAFFQRTVFHSGAQAEFNFAQFQPESIRLNQANVAEAILASGSIPLVMQGVSNIAGAPTGNYRDGGITDYHFDFSFAQPDGLLLYPHFYSHITPGWYDKLLRWRRIGGAALRNTVILAPTPEFVAGLPYGKIPDRRDFTALGTAERQSYWTDVCRQSERLAEDFYSAWQSGSLPARLQAL